MNRSHFISRNVAYMIWIVASLFYAYQYVLRVMPNIMLSDIMHRFDIDAAVFGQFSGVYYIGYSLIHLPIGIMLDRFGPRKVMSACTLLTVIGLLPLVLAHHWSLSIIGRLLIGIGSSAAILGVFKIIRMVFKEERFARMLSLSVMIGLIGAIYGGGPIHAMREVLGYDAIVYLFMAAGVLLSIATYWIVPEFESTFQGTVVTNVKEVLSNANVIKTCIFAGLMVGPLEGFADVWGTAFLKNVFGIDMHIAASLPSIIFIGMCFGSPLLNWLAEKAGNYLFTVAAAGFTMSALFFLLLLTKPSHLAITFNFIIMGICCAYQILAIYKASTFVREEVAGLTTALANMIIMIFGYLFHSMMGGIINAMGGPENSKALLCGVGALPIALCIGSLGFTYLFFKERQSKKKEAV